MTASSWFYYEVLWVSRNLCNFSLCEAGMIASIFFQLISFSEG